MSHVTKLLKERAKANTIKLFENNGGKHTKKMYADKENSIVGTDGTYQIYKYKKQELNTPKILQRAIRSSITQIITGHAPTNHYLHKIGKSPTNACRLCEEEDETIEHIIIRSPAMQLKRHLNYECISYKEHITAVRNNWGKTVKIFKEFIRDQKVGITRPKQREEASNKPGPPPSSPLQEPPVNTQLTSNPPRRPRANRTLGGKHVHPSKSLTCAT